jgi:hemerythrin superfamily protein
MKVLLAIDGVEELLAKDHKQLDKLLGAVLTALEGENSVEAFETLDLFWVRLAMHIRAENLHLFPSVLNKVKGEDDESQLEYLPLRSREVQKAIERLSADHNFFMQQLSRAIRILRETPIASDSVVELETVREIIGGVSERLTAHNELEEMIIYQMPGKLLPREEQIKLATRIQRELKNLPPRFT